MRAAEIFKIFLTLHIGECGNVWGERARRNTDTNTNANANAKVLREKTRAEWLNLTFKISIFMRDATFTESLVQLALRRQRCRSFLSRTKV